MEPAMAENEHDQHAYVENLFPDLDLSAALEAHKHLSPEALVGWIVDNMNRIPRKKKAIKRKAADDGGVEAPLDFSGFFDASLRVGPTMLTKMLWQMTVIIRKELEDGQKAGRKEWEARSGFLLNHFQLVKAEFARKVVNHFQGRMVASALACWFNQNGVSNLIQQSRSSLLLETGGVRFSWAELVIQNESVAGATGLKMHFLYSTLKTRRSRVYNAAVGDDAMEEWNRYLTLLADFKKRFPSLFVADANGEEDRYTLIPDASGIPMVEDEEDANEEGEEEIGGESCGEKIECLVCLDEHPIMGMVFCIPPVHRVVGEGSDMPSTSAASTSATADNSEAAVHAFCRKCLKGQAKAANDEMPLAEGGVGLRCMAYDCRNPLPWTEVCRFIGSEVKKKLDERMAEENLGLASIPNLERCRKCNFAVEMEVSVEVNKVFECYACESKHCRLCEADWDEDHFGVSCEELEKNNAESKKQRALEKKLNEAVVRKCPKCGVAFMKSDGCNKMTCRCGMTMCYICRTTPITYDHFCQHYRDPNILNYKCAQCNKSCLLHEDSSKKDEKVIADIKKEAAMGDAEHAQPGTSAIPDMSWRTTAGNYTAPTTDAQQNNPVMGQVVEALNAAQAFAQQVQFALGQQRPLNQQRQMNQHQWMNQQHQLNHQRHPQHQPHYFNPPPNFQFRQPNHNFGGNHQQHQMFQPPPQYRPAQPQAPAPYQPQQPPPQLPHMMQQQMYPMPLHADIPAPPPQYFNNNSNNGNPVQPPFRQPDHPYQVQAMAAGVYGGGIIGGANMAPPQ